LVAWLNTTSPAFDVNDLVVEIMSISPDMMMA